MKPQDTATAAVVTADVVIFTIQGGELKLLLVRRADDPCRGQWALPSDQVRMDEDLEQTAMRALQVQTGVHGVYLEQLYTFGRPSRYPIARVIAVAYYALVPSEKLQLQAAGNAEAVDWFALNQLSNLAFDHAEIVTTASRRLSAKLDYSTIAFQFMPAEFTLSDLQQVYEVVRQEQLDKRNFRKWILAQGRIEKTGRMRRNGSHRPASLFRVKNPHSVEIIRQGRSASANNGVEHGQETRMRPVGQAAAAPVR